MDSFLERQFIMHIQAEESSLFWTEHFMQEEMLLNLSRELL